MHTHTRIFTVLRILYVYSVALVRWHLMCKGLNGLCLRGGLGWRTAHISRFDVKSGIQPLSLRAVVEIIACHRICFHTQTYTQTSRHQNHPHPPFTFLSQPSPLITKLMHKTFYLLACQWRARMHTNQQTRAQKHTFIIACQRVIMMYTVYICRILCIGIQA